VRNYIVEVLPETVGNTTRYKIRASTTIDARVIAFALDGGFSLVNKCVDEGQIELVKTYTKVVRNS